MASTQNSNVFASNNKVTQYAQTTDHTSATDVAWVDMRDFNRFWCSTLATVLAGNGVTAFTILANSESDGSGTDVEVKAHAVGDAPNAVGDWLQLECSAEEVRSVETTSSGQLRYVTANLTANNSGDDSAVTYVLSEPRFAEDGLTADVVA